MDAEAVIILTEWDEIRNKDLNRILILMCEPIIFDGRNCLSIEEVKKHNIEYYSIGRTDIKNR